MQFSVIDYIVIVVYLVGVAFLGLKSSGKQTSNKDYFLGGEGIPWWAVLFSIVATETSTLTFISIPAVAYGGNLTFLQITVGYVIGRIGVALFFLPKYYEGELFTAYTFLEKRFGAGMRNAASSTFMITRLLADGVRLFATAIPLAIILRLGGAFSGWGDLELYILSICVITAITLVYTFFGGIKAVVWMDFVQMIVYIGGALIAVGVLLGNLPAGFELPAEKLQLVNLGFDMSFREFIAQPYTLITALVGGAVFSLASHGTDQLLVQRVLATRNLKSGQKAMIWSGIVAMLQFALFMGIGLLLYMFYEGVSATEIGLATTDEVFAKFIVEQLPVGVSGLIVAALFAAAMSSLSSSLNSLASSTTYDLYKPYFGKNNTEAEDLSMSRKITMGWGIILTASAVFFAILQLQGGERPAIVELGLGIASYTYGGLLGAFLLGMFFSKPDKTDALIGFFCGLIALLFMVQGPIQNLLPGDGLAIAWPLYTLVGSLIVVITGSISAILRGSKHA
ncbi:sodium:solute symporter [Gracilimonas sediminicola]|uniref:Sodium:solute symporter n=1 Tax=Gracilimonas sediminicola TaxID=2952158 RepID=A0A9X2L1P3_9BACT|nr:sodium:solute symporter [Gracilimonas sediminicola]MCP9290670.1 sodium:solute symporter [Gracilimonas sediminicola]